jgi:hypothetical protein
LKIAESNCKASIAVLAFALIHFVADSFERATMFVWRLCAILQTSWALQARVKPGIARWGNVDISTPAD